MDSENTADGRNGKKKKSKARMARGGTLMLLLLLLRANSLSKYQGYAQAVKS